MKRALYSTYGFLTDFFSGSKRKRLIFFSALLVIFVIGVMFPYIIRNYLNSFIFNDMGKYRGHVEYVSINLFSGAYALYNFKVVRKTSNKGIPFFKTEKFLVYANVRALLNGNISFSAELVRPQLNFLDAKREQDRQTGEGGTWLEAIESIVPANLAEIDVSEGTLTFANMDSEPAVDIKVENIAISVTNLTNLKDLLGKKVAKAEISGKVLKHGSASVDIAFNPSNYADFDFKLEAYNIHLKQANDLFRAYAKLDFEDGVGEIFSEISGGNGAISGYIKPLFKDINILSWSQDVEEQEDNLIQFAWEGLIGFFNALFTNYSTDKFATEIEIKGTVDNIGFDMFHAVWGIIKNAFGDAMEAGIESKNGEIGKHSADPDQLTNKPDQ